MKKNRLLFLWLSLLLCAVGTRAEEVEIGSLDEALDDTYLPMNSLYEYSFTQQIYTADEIGTAGTINAITVYLYGKADLYEMPFDIYMVETDKDAFESTTDWIPVTASDVVYSGTVTVHNTDAEAYTFTLNTPFNYSGTGNLVICFNNYTGQWKGGLNGKVFADNATRALYARRDGTAYDPTDMSGITANGIVQRKNVIILDITTGAGPTCPKPKGVSVTNTTTTTATVEWNAEEGTQYNIHLLSESSEATFTGVTSPYTLTGLEAATSYTVQVQTACSDTETSDWTSPLAFTTAICEEEDQCLMTYSLADSYGDGWNGASLRVTDIETGKTLATLTLTSGGKDAPVEGAFAVCPGREISFVWTPGNYPGECSFTITDVNGDEILSVAKGEAPTTSDVLATYLVDCTLASCFTPKDLTVDEVAAYTATLSWTPGSEDQSAWEIVYGTEADFDPDTATPVAADSNPFELTGLQPETTYYAYVRGACSSDDHSKWSNMVSFTTIEACVTPTDVTATDITANSATITWEGAADNYELQYAVATSTWLQYDDDTFVSGIGNTTAATWTWGVMYPGSMVTFDKLTNIAIYESSTYNTADITVNIYSGGDDAPGTLLATQVVKPQAADAMHVVTLDSPVDITPGENLWITLTETGTYVLSYCASDEPNNNWVFDGSTWAHVSDLVSSLAGDGWMIRAFVGDSSVEPSWTTDATSENSYDLSGLDPSTTYVFQVRAKCDEESFSKWAEVNFTTEAADAGPEIEITEIAATTATVDWTDKGLDPTSWDVWYRLAGESFEAGLLPEGWTTIDADGDGNNWYVDGNSRNHNGSYCITSASYDNNSGALTPDNWLISPEVTLGGSMTFWAVGQDADWAAEHFAVYLSQDGNTDPSTFTQIYPATGEEVGTGEYVQYTVDLSKYKGKGYLAIRHFNCSDMFRLNIDDILILEPGQTNDWVEMNGLTSQPAELEGLTPETTYEVQVRTHFASGDVSNWVGDTFTTAPESITLLDKDYDSGSSNKTLLEKYNGMTIDVTISGRTFLRNGNWNTLSLPFAVADIEASPLAGATVKELTAARIEDETLFLTYTDVTSIEAGKSYIIKWNGGENGDMTFEDVTLDVLYADYDGVDYGSDIYSFCLYTEFILGASQRLLYLGTDNKMYYIGQDNFHIGAFRNIIQIPEDAEVNGTTFEIDDTATGIEEIDGLEIVGGKWYTLDGRQLPAKPKQKGIYINNGRKVVVK